MNESSCGMINSRRQIVPLASDWLLCKLPANSAVARIFSWITCCTEFAIDGGRGDIWGFADIYLLMIKLPKTCFHIKPIKNYLFTVSDIYFSIEYKFVYKDKFYKMYTEKEKKRIVMVTF